MDIEFSRLEPALYKPTSSHTLRRKKKEAANKMHCEIKSVGWNTKRKASSGVESLCNCLKPLAF
jgi:hypothetical protein